MKKGKGSRPNVAAQHVVERECRDTQSRTTKRRERDMSMSTDADFRTSCGQR